MFYPVFKSSIRSNFDCFASLSERYYHRKEMMSMIIKIPHNTATYYVVFITTC